MRLAHIVFVLALPATIAIAQAPPEVEDDHRILNPDDTCRAMLVRKIEMGVIASGDWQRCVPKLGTPTQ